MDEDAEIIAEFLVESHENLDQLDRDLVALEKEPGSRELLSSIFRTIHTIKGTSGFLGFGQLERLTHVGENLLSKLRDGELPLTVELTGTLLRMVDTVRHVLAVIELSSTDEQADVEAITATVVLLQAALTPTDAALEPAEPTPEAIPASEQEVAAPVADLPAPAPEPVVPPAPVPTPTPVQYDAPKVPEPVAVEQHHEQHGEPHRGIVDSSVRVDVDLLDNLVQLVGELVLTRNQILQRADSQTGPLADADLVRAAQRLDLVASELQESVMQTRMQPIGQVWAKMPRIVRDLALQLGVEVELDMSGHETELDRSLLEAVRDPLTHLVRNALDHGIETPEVRAARGKPTKGSLALRARHESGQVVIEISDDGAGIDPAKVAEAAIARGVITQEQAARMEPRDLVQLVFRPGFSTAAQVTNVSGRGVGMDVVRTNIERIGGSVDLSGQVGLGTMCRVRIPLTLAIIPALVVGEGGERYAIPQANLVELVRLEGDERDTSVETLAGAEVMRLRGHLLPLVHLADVLGTERLADSALTVIVVQADDLRFGICVDEVHDTQEIVVKPIGRQLKGLATYAGATIMGDGRVALILDVPGIAQVENIGAVDDLDDRSATNESHELDSLLVLEVGGGRRAALPLQAVSRLEEFDIAQIELSGSTEVVQYREGILPLLRLAPAIGLVEPVCERTQLSVVVYEDGGARIGIVIDRVLDVVEAAVVRSDVGRRPGVLGSAVIEDRVTDLVDLGAVTGATNRAMAGVG